LLFKALKKDMKKSPNESKNFIVLIDFTEVKSTTIEKVKEWLTLYGEILIEFATKELGVIIKDTADYEKQLKAEMGGIDSLKQLLNVISEIKNKSMDMEFRINEVQEYFRILKMYKY
jgi:hypothetical protein